MPASIGSKLHCHSSWPGCRKACDPGTTSPPPPPTTAACSGQGSAQVGAAANRRAPGWELTFLSVQGLFCGPSVLALPARAPGLYLPAVLAPTGAGVCCAERPGRESSVGCCAQRLASWPGQSGAIRLRAAASPGGKQILGESTQAQGHACCLVVLMGSPRSPRDQPRTPSSVLLFIRCPFLPPPVCMRRLLDPLGLECTFPWALGQVLQSRGAGWVVLPLSVSYTRQLISPARLREQALLTYLSESQLASSSWGWYRADLSNAPRKSRAAAA